MQNMQDTTDANPLQTMIQVARTRSNAVIPNGKRPATNKVRRNTDGTLKNKYANVMQYK